MESFPEMTNKVTALVRATGIEDPGRMSGAGTERGDPEVPEKARRRTFTAKYKLEILAAYDAAPAGEGGGGARGGPVPRSAMEDGVCLRPQVYVGAVFLSRRQGTPVVKSVGFFGDVFPLGVFGEPGGL